MGQVGLSHLPGLISMTQKGSVAEIFPSGPRNAAAHWGTKTETQGADSRRQLLTFLDEGRKVLKGLIRCRELCLGGGFSGFEDAVEHDD